MKKHKLEKRRKIIMQHAIQIMIIFISIAFFSFVLNSQFKENKTYQQLPAPTIIFKTDAATRFFTMKFLSATPQGQAVLAAYQGATMFDKFSKNPGGTLLSVVSGQVESQVPGFSSAVQVAMGASPAAVVGSMALSQAKEEIISGVFDSLPPDQQIAFIQVQQYAAYANQFIEIDDNKAKELAEKISYDEKTGIFKYEDKEKNQILQLPKDYRMTSEPLGILSIQSGIKSDPDQEFKFQVGDKSDKLSLYLQSGRMDIRDDKIVELNCVISKESRLKLGDNEELIVPEGANINYNDRDGELTVNGKVVCQYGKEKLSVDNEKGSSIKIKGKHIVCNGCIYKDIKFQGALDIEDGYYSLYDDNVYNINAQAEIRGVKITPRIYSDEKLKIFFDGKEHDDGLYISFGDDRVVTGSGKLESLTEVETEFLPSNEYIKVAENDYLSIVNIRASTVTVTKDSKIDLKYKDYDGGLVRINNGKYGLNFEQNYVSSVIVNDRKEKQTVDLEVTAKGKDGRDLIGNAYTPAKLKFENNKLQAYTINDNKKIAFFDGSNDIKTFKSRYKNINLEFESKAVKKQATVAQLSRDIDRLPNRIREKIKEVKFADKSIKEKGEFRVAQSFFGGYIEIPVDYSASTFFHEACHTFGVSSKFWDLVIKERDIREATIKKVISIAKKHDIKLDKKNINFNFELDGGKLTFDAPTKYSAEDQQKINQWNEIMASEVNPLLNSASNEYLDFFNSQLPLLAKWKEIAGDVYGKDKTGVDMRGDKFAFLLWNDDSDGPANGLIDAYAATSVNEDLSDFCKELYTRSPESFFNRYSAFLDAKSPTYDPRYMEKIKLLDKEMLLPTTGYMGELSSLIK